MDYFVHASKTRLADLFSMPACEQSTPMDV